MFADADLDRLVAAMRATGVTVLDIEDAHHRLRLVLPGASREAPPEPDPPHRRHLAATSPGIGTFLSRGDDDGLPVLAPGAEVSAGEVLGYVCQGPVRAIVTSPATGVLTGTLPEAGTLFGSGDIVFDVETAS